MTPDNQHFFNKNKCFQSKRVILVNYYIYLVYKRELCVMSWSHMTSHVIDLTRSGQFQIITDPASCGWLCHQSPDYLTFRINLLTFGSTFWISLLNQPTRSAFSLNWRRHWLVVRHFLQTYVRRIVLLPTEIRMIQVVGLLTDHPLVKVWSISPSNTPWWWCGWKPCWTQLKTSSLCKHQLHLQESQNDENDEGFGSRPVAPRPNEYVGLDLTWSDAETSAGARLEL